MKSKSIDIIITTRNRLAELKYTLDTMKSLGFGEERFFIMDDASTDFTHETIKTEYPLVRIEKNDIPKGYIYNRNYMMANSTGDYILSLDDDSHIRSGEDINEAIELLESNATYGIFGFRPFEQKENPPDKSQLESSVRFVKGYIGCGHIIKREVFDAVGPYREEFEFYCEELDFSIRAFKLGYRVITKDNLVVHHRIDWKQRSKQKKSDSKKGVYGAVWRSKLGFSNHLIIRGIYYPFPWVFFNLAKYSLARFYNFFIKKGDFKGYIYGLLRFVKFTGYIAKNRNGMTKKDFSAWNAMSQF